MSDTLYIKMDRCVEVTHKNVTIGDVAKLECKNVSIVNKIKPIKLLSDLPSSKNRYVVSIMEIIKIIDSQCQNVEISNIGETDCIVEFNEPNSEKNGLPIQRWLLFASFCFLVQDLPLCHLTMMFQLTRCLSRSAIK